MSEITIASVMRTVFLTLAPDMPIREATARLVADRAASAPVVDGTGRLVGILTQKDCFRPALAASYHQQWQGSVAETMSREVATLDSETDIVGAAEAFLAAPYRSYPVTRNGALVGILERDTLLDALLQNG